MSDIPTRLRHLVETRASGRCEYCRLFQAGQEARFHVDHIVPRVLGGTTSEENLALACVSCSLRKQAQRSAIDPDSGRRISLFHPRRQRWDAHFRWEGVLLIGKTSTGRVTIDALKMNRPLALAIRAEEQARGRHPFADPPHGP